MATIYTTIITTQGDNAIVWHEGAHDAPKVGEQVKVVLWVKGIRIECVAIVDFIRERHGYRDMTGQWI